MPLWAVRKPVGTTTAALPFGRQRIHDVLDKEQVDRHLVFAFGRDFGNTRKETLVVGFGIQVVAEVAEIQLEGRVRDDVIELLQVCRPSRW